MVRLNKKTKKSPDAIRCVVIIKGQRYQTVVGTKAVQLAERTA